MGNTNIFMLKLYILIQLNMKWLNEILSNLTDGEIKSKRVKVKVDKNIDDI